MTATIHDLSSGRNAGSYYTSDPRREALPHRRDEYYVGTGSPDGNAGGGIWWSSGQTIVEHGAPVDAEVFRDLCAGLDPRTGDGPRTAKGLVRGAGEGHRAGWDITFSAPKTVGLLWAAGNERQRSIIQAAHRGAVDRALAFVEREGLLDVRLGAGGARRERPTDVLIACFDHVTSREGDPNLHTHSVILNVALSADGRYRTLEPRSLYAWQKTVGAAYRMHLSEELHRAGFLVRQAGRSQFEIAGIRQDLIDRFSKRGAQIEAVVGDRADVSGRQKEIANLATRQGKELVPTGDALEARWREEFADDRDLLWNQALTSERGRQHAVVPNQPSSNRDHLNPGEGGAHLEDFPVTPEVDGASPVARAASELLHHEIVIDRRRVLERAFALASLEGCGEQAVLNELTSLEAQNRLLPLATDATRDAVWTTPELARLETEMLDAVQRANERVWLTEEAIETALLHSPHLAGEQIEAVRAAGTRNGVALLQAGAGTGKTTTARPIVEAAELSGLKVLGLAPSWVAADELRKSTGIPAVAIAKWLHGRKHGVALPLDEHTLVIVDEASMVGTRDMAAILIAARQTKAKVLLVGDQRQLEAVGAGGPLRIVADALNREATLAQVRRQQIAWQREASIAMSKGDVATGVQAYFDHGAIETAEGRDATLARSISAWAELRRRHRGDVLMITRRNKDVADLNRSARALLKAEGRLAHKEIMLPSINREGKIVQIPIAVGDSLRFGQSHPALALRNGSLLTVKAVINRGDSARVILQFSDKRQIEVDWHELAPVYRGTIRPPRIVHAYASTVYGAQGRTVAASVYTAIIDTDARELYVALTRHAEDMKIIVAQEAGSRGIAPTMGMASHRLMRWSQTAGQKRNVIDFSR
jgi:conjugative relaxase-like TrwC/TraI family protein